MTVNDRQHTLNQYFPLNDILTTAKTYNLEHLWRRVRKPDRYCRLAMSKIVHLLQYEKGMI